MSSFRTSFQTQLFVVRSDLTPISSTHAAVCLWFSLSLRGAFAVEVWSGPLLEWVVHAVHLSESLSPSSLSKFSHSACDYAIKCIVNEGENSSFLSTDPFAKIYF